MVGVTHGQLWHPVSTDDPDLQAGLSAFIEEFLLVEAALCSCPDGICVCDERSE